MLYDPLQSDREHNIHADVNRYAADESINYIGGARERLCNDSLDLCGSQNC